MKNIHIVPIHGKRAFIWLTALLLTGALLAARAEPALRWRMQLLIGKTVGLMGGVPWSDVWAGILPHRVRDAIDFEALRVTAESSGPGPCSALWHTRLGSFWGRPGDDHSLELALKYRLYDEFYLRGEASVREGDTVIDAGAHLGTFTAFALARGAGRVILFEPDPVSAACLRQTFASGIDSRTVVVLEEAAWHEPALLTFRASSDSLQGSVSISPSPPASAPVVVRATTIDDTVENLSLDRIDVIKLNIEGAERLAIQGARQTLRRFRPRIVVNLEHRIDDPEVIPGLVRTLVSDYQIRWRGREQAFFYCPGR